MGCAICDSGFRRNIYGLVATGRNLRSMKNERRRSGTGSQAPGTGRRIPDTGSRPSYPERHSNDRRCFMIYITNYKTAFTILLAFIFCIALINCQSEHPPVQQPHTMEPVKPELAIHINALIADLNSYNDKIHENAVTELKSLGHITKPFLAVALYDTEPRIQFQASALLYRLAMQEFDIKPYLRGKVLAVSYSVLILTINIGQHDDVNINDRFVVLRDNEFIGDLRVYKVINSHCSACEILSHLSPIEKDDSIYTPFLNDYLNRY